MTLNDFLANQPRGAAAAMARELSVNAQNFSAWRSGKRSVPIYCCVQIEKMTDGQVTRKDLRPSDWFLIWPELAT